MSFREKQKNLKEFVAFEAHAETYIENGKPLAQNTDGPWYKYNSAGRVCENKSGGGGGMGTIRLGIVRRRSRNFALIPTSHPPLPLPSTHSLPILSSTLNFRRE